MEVAKALERIASGYQYNWWKRGPIVEFRDRNWFMKRSTQIPEAWMESWRSAFKKTGTLDLDMLAQIAAIERDQYNANVRYDEVLGQRDLFMLMLYNDRILRLYASLDDAQRAMVFTEQGLSFEGLTPEQFAKAREAMKYCLRFREDPSLPARLTGKRTEKGKLYEYSFRVNVDEDGGGGWHFTTPEYKPPAPAQPKPAAKQSGLTAGARLLTRLASPDIIAL